MKNKLFFVFFFALFIIIPMTKAASNKIIWTPNNIQLTLGLGDIRDIAASFVSNTNMSDVDLWVVPELQAFVRLAPNHFDTVVAGSNYSVSIHFSVPLGTETRLYNGTIHARIASKTIPQTLKINLIIVEAAKTIGPEGGSVIVPDGSVSAVIPVGALSENTLITIKQTGEQGPVGNIYEFGPTGLSFSRPITISIGFYQASLPQNVDEGDLFLATECDGGYIEPLENISVDTFNKRVIGQTWHFSDVWITHGILVVDANNNPIFSQNIPLATSFRMPIGDLRDFRTTPITCHDGLSYSSEDLGNDISLLTIGAYINNYPKIEFNSGVAENLNRWIVSVAFNKNQQLASYATGELASYGVFHPGEDWNRRLGGSSDDGRPIHAIADGVILYSQTQKSTISKRADGTAGFGNIVVIGHKLNDGSIIASVYAHMRALSPCAVGEHINKGDIIGLIGDTGSIYANGNPIPNNHHLHFEIIKTTITSNASSNVSKIDSPVIDEASSKIYIRYSNNSGWYWPKTEQKIYAHYIYPSEFIKSYAENKLVPNPSFEDGTGQWPTGWEPYRFATFNWDNTMAYTGTRSVSVSNVASGQLGGWVTTSFIPVDPAKEYEISVWFFQSDTPIWYAFTYVGFLEYDANGTELGGWSWGVDSHSVGSWTHFQMSYAGRLRPQTTKVKIILWCHNWAGLGQNAIVWFDDVKIIQK